MGQLCVASEMTVVEFRPILRVMISGTAVITIAYPILDIVALSLWLAAKSAQTLTLVPSRSYLGQLTYVS